MSIVNSSLKDAKKYFYIIRAVHEWNKMSNESGTANSIQMFKVV